jgi:hypothetical protein
MSISFKTKPVALSARLESDHGCDRRRRGAPIGRPIDAP